MANTITRREAHRIAEGVKYPTSAHNRIGLAHAIADAILEAFPDALVTEIPNKPDVAEKSFSAQVHEELSKVEEELLLWSSGQRSFMNEQMNAETYYTDPESGLSQPDRGLTLIRVAQRDAAEIEIATNRLIALRLLAGLTKEGTI